MEVRAYREKPIGKTAPKGTAQALWTYLTDPAAAKVSASKFATGSGTL